MRMRPVRANKQLAAHETFPATVQISKTTQLTEERPVATAGYRRAANKPTSQERGPTPEQEPKKTHATPYLQVSFTHLAFTS